MKFILLIPLTILYHQANAQYRLAGTITNKKMEPLAFASLQLKGRPTGILSKEDGSYSIDLNSGIYDLVISMIGYHTKTVKVVINKQNVIHPIILEEADNSLSSITIRARTKDRAEDYIRQVIRHKDDLQAAPGAYSCNIYIKAVQEDSITPKAIKKKPVKDSLIKKNPPPPLSMSEIYLRLDYESAARYKEERTGVTRRGNTTNLFYLSTTQGRFNFYDNLVKVPALSVTPFLSPVSYSGLIAYKFQTLKTEKRGSYN
ncbi:MAG TPA: DUF5686 family protein, partial [Niabella sp.]|nr:DUF5686 family protein [Niabella sp.]